MATGGGSQDDQQPGENGSTGTNTQKHNSGGEGDHSPLNTLNGHRKGQPEICVIDIE